jgi:multisubunit Na+/H+ antiporter MnhE subunit
VSSSRHTHRQSGARPPHRRAARERGKALAVGVLLAGGFYLVVIDTTSLPELYTGAVIALLAAVGYVAAREQERPEPSYRARWMLRAWRPILRIPADVVRVSVELALQLVAPRGRRGTLRAVPFAHGGEGPGDIGRRAVTELAGSLAPNTIVIGVDAERNLLLVHQLQRSGDADALDAAGLG